jgi:hypothetical protein
VLKQLAETGNPDFAPREGLRNSNSDRWSDWHRSCQ